MMKNRIIKRTGLRAVAMIDGLGQRGLAQGYAFGRLKEVMRFNELLNAARRGSLTANIGLSAFLFSLAAGTRTADFLPRTGETIAGPRPLPVSLKPKR